VADINRPKGKQPFDMNSGESIVTRGAAAAAGAWFGGRVGMVGGPLGGISGTVAGRHRGLVPG
jgi:hypothetical protein